MTLDELHTVLLERNGYQSELRSKAVQISGFRATIEKLEREAAYLQQKISDLETRIKV